VTVTIDLFIASISKTADFQLGYLSLPKPIFLAGQLADGGNGAKAAAIFI